MNANSANPSLYPAALMTDTKVRTGLVRVCFVSLLKPSSTNGGPEKYSASVLIPKSDTQCVETVQQAIDNAVKAGVRRYGPGFNSARTHLPLHDGDTEKDDPAYQDCWYLSPSSFDQPGVVGPDRREITDPHEIYSGMYGRFTLRFYPYNNTGSGIGVELLNFQKLSDGEPLGRYRAPAASDFGAPDEANPEDDFFA